ncbi:MAG: glycosyltransferase family 4 protein [Methanobacteriaceae archaeon]|nr:glycosyltransferase family 4 protein [Methanobacteriaceae archaeon]
MKILQTPVRFYPFTGGVENYVYYLSKELVKLGHQVKVVCAQETGETREETIDGVKVSRVPFTGKVANTNLTWTMPLKLVQEDFDIMHTHLPTPWNADWSMIISRLKNKPLVLSYYNDIIGSGLSNYVARFYNSTGLKLLLKAADRIIIIQENYRHFSPHLADFQDKIVVVPCGVDTDKFRPAPCSMEENSPEGNTLFFLSVLDEFHHYKGLDYLLEALQIVKKKIPPIKLIVGGKGNLINYYQEQVNSMGLENNVEFHGFIPDEKLPDYYNQCDVFVLPSISSAQEGFGIVALEALACAKPVISTKIVGIAQDLEETGSGIIVTPKDSQSLADAIINVLNSENSCKMGLSGRKLVEDKYTWKKVARLTNDIYQELV